MIRALGGSTGFLCHGTLELTGEGSLTFSGAFLFQNPATVAITGGTGRFAGARGAMTGYELNAEADQLYVFDFSASRN